ncbi:carbon-monoxide dehydrogenase large subunit [Stella humosa]|uniref:Carbon-monoxide dehydrogenase large subunit n=1 Tax=Stella humosa TaxID=94 RepID=A0A3N1MBW7_9PROT|nr:xanthine dehydrogenase family protein molybdopterin-binding subunit [Stella humosa]ROQ00197.1 carbon-monoxide dehydrogenase large subunit [Stella humosa]BBK30568.1 carbon monoxide dehydrogenase [Stella humosa]
MGQFGMGQAVRRVEDLRLLTGNGRYTDDISLPRQTVAHILRSPHAHAVINSIDTTAAKAAPGVLGVFTCADLRADGVGDLPCLAPLTSIDGTPSVSPPRPALADGRVRHVGDAVVLIVAETMAQARDAAELVEIDYDQLPAATDTGSAGDADQPQVWDQAPGNLCFDWAQGDEEGVAQAFAKAHKTVSVEVVNNRLVVNSMEPRGAIGDFQKGDGRYVLHTSSQGPHLIRSQLAGAIFKVPDHRVRVVTQDVGGGFGMKIFLYPEHVLVTWAAKKVGRPVKWISERQEAFLSDTQGRDNVTRADMALDAEGRFLALKVETRANLGAHLSNFAPYIPTYAGTGMLAGVYSTPIIHVRVKGLFTHTTPVDAYRGAGRPEAAYLVERLADVAADAMGISPAEIRRRNFIPGALMPFRTALGITYDSGEFQQNMEDALKLGDWDGFEARRAAAATKGKLRGIGLATYIEQCGGGEDEAATVRFDPSGSVTVLVGNQSNGQGHETAYAQIVADALSVPFESVRVLQGDSDVVYFGRGTGGSRALPVGGSAVQRAVEKIVEKAKKVAAHMMETATADIEFKDGVFQIAGTDRKVGIQEVVQTAFNPGALGDVEPGLSEVAHFTPAGATFPNGCHVCELEVDPETGNVEIVRYTVVDDFGRVVNPMMLAGQVHGGIAQGVGQALYESTVYDGGSGQLVTGSLMDYALPRADNLPMVQFAWNVVPCRNNPLGVKGSGEAGAIGAPPAVINAIVDALRHLGVNHIDMPATPQRLWSILQGAKKQQAA